MEPEIIEMADTSGPEEKERQVGLEKETDEAGPGRSSETSPEALSRFLSGVRIARSMRRYTIRRKTQLKSLKHMMRGRYLELAHEQEQARSSASRQADPVLPEGLNLGETKTALCKQGMFLSAANPSYAFIYKIFKHYESAGADPGQDSAETASDEAHIRYSWSIFVKVRGRVHAIWQYHRFSDEMLAGVMSHGGCGDPLDKLAGLFKQIAKGAADLAMAEANETKDAFMVDEDGPAATPGDPGASATVSLKQS